MTDTKPVQPVEAWAVVDNDGQISLHIEPYDNEHAKRKCERGVKRLDNLTPEYAPHRVVRVQIKLVETGEG